jgi:hypothetical protein
MPFTPLRIFQVFFSIDAASIKGNFVVDDPSGDCPKIGPFILFLLPPILDQPDQSLSVLPV